MTSHSHENPGEMVIEHFRPVEHTHVSQPPHGEAAILAASPTPHSQDVYRFSEGHVGILCSVVYDPAGNVAYRFDSQRADNGCSFTMYTGDGTKAIATVHWARWKRAMVNYGGVEMKLKHFITRNSGNTGPIFTINGLLYEWLQDIFFAVIRTTPGAERVALVYNSKEKPEVEILPEGHRADIIEAIIFVTALFECGLWRNTGYAGAGVVSKLVPGTLSTKVPGSLLPSERVE